MGSYNNDTNTSLNSHICEAAGCFAKATEEIPVRIGRLGAISLLLCSDCVSIFQEPVTRYNLEQSKAEQSLESQIKEKKALEQVGSQESNTIPRNQLHWTMRNKEDDCEI